ncbi:MAG: bifunctional ornithine acetyltransferase/N-acetylglutamate synthase, partial [SAR202 cluster bacterium]|nr:bifunctional ornithine acetyltransferase/N-acetylglutamate synthase [SAR202 cluster bacterium]
MASMIEIIKGGGVTSAKGFLAGATYAGLKSSAPDALDIGILVSECPAAVAGTFTTSKIVSPSVTVSKNRVAGGSARAVVANSGNANCAVGEQGFKDAEEMTSLAANMLGLAADEVLVASTGLIGAEMPM